VKREEIEPTDEMPMEKMEKRESVYSAESDSTNTTKDSY
jgi:hypothetical protein